MNSFTKTKREKKPVDILHGNISANMIRYAIPLVLTNVLQNLYNTADNIVVGNMGSTTALASVGATGSITSLLVNITVTVFIGMKIMLAHQLGSGNSDAARRTTSTGYTVALGLGLLVALLGQLLTGTLLDVTDCPSGEVYRGAETYLRIYFLGVPFLIFTNYSAAVFRVNGDSKTPFIYMSLSGAVNVVCNVIFVLVLGDPVLGVALATFISMLLSAVLLFIRQMRIDGPCRLVPLRPELHMSSLSRILHYGLPASISSATFAISNFFIAPAVNAFGEVGISGNLASNSLESYLYTITGAFTVTVSTFMGQNIGAGNKERTKESLVKAYILSCTVSLLLTALGLLFNEQLIRLFISDSDAAVEFGKLRMLYIFYPAVLQGVMCVNSGALQAYGKTMLQMISNIIGVLIFRIIWMSLIYPLAREPWLLWLCYPVSWVLTGLSLLAVVICITSKMLKGDAINI
ncbi:MAG: MATE family efflux transporter [Clostridia bacterium]|nr:MATE family efflux transporter [Clostridia bacterium]